MKAKRRGCFRAGLLWLLLAGLATPVLAQAVTATITGTVTDPTGNAVRAATVTAVNRSTGVEYPTKSNDAGIYTITGLPIGSYAVRAELAGFKTVTTNPIGLEVGQSARINIKLEIGAVTEQVEVVDVNPILQTENAVVGEVITGSTATALPLNNRNFAQLTLLAPGVQTHAPETFNQVKNSAGEQSGRPYVNGQREQANNFMLDGLDMNETIDNLIAYYPSPDALAEIRIETNNYSAEFGNVAGGIINTVMKSGSNAFHGNAFEFLRNDAFDANSWSNNKSGADKAELKQHIFGGTIGGPIVKNRLFFFADYQGVRLDQPGDATASVAPVEWRQGDFSSLLASGVVIRDPLTGQPFPGNRVPTSRFSPAARALLADTKNYPVPNRPGLSGNLVGQQQQSTRNHQGDFKLDANFGPKDNAWLRVSFGHYDNPTSQTVIPLQLGGAWQSSAQSGAANWTHVFGSSMVNEVRLGFNRVTVDRGEPTDWAGVGNYNSTLGIPGTQAAPGLSALNWSSAGIDSIGSDTIIDTADDRTFQLSEKLSFSRGRHFFTTGFQALRYNMQRNYPGNNGVLGHFTFSGNFTGFAFSDFLLDQVTQKGIGGASPWEQNQNRIGVYAQDDFKVNPRLTLNLGLRWEYTSPLVEKNDNQVNYDLTTGQAIFAGAIPTSVCAGYKPGCAQGSRALYDSYYGGFGPRVGFAWTPGDRTVVRGAFGIVQYMEGTGANNRLPVNPPFAREVQRDFTARAGTLTTGFDDAAPSAPGLGVGQLRVFQTDLRPQLTKQWNLFLERRVTDTTSLSVGYVGSRATHVAIFTDSNQPLPGVGNPENWVDGQLRRPLHAVLPDAGPVRTTGSSGIANYDGLQTSLRRRQAKGLEFLASYTYSKSLTDNQGFYGPGWGGYSATNFNIDRGSGYQNTRDPLADYGPTWFSSKHTFSLAGSYELPIGKGRKVGTDWSGAQQAFLGGWNVSGILSARSGLPLTVTDGWGNRSLQPSFAYERPDRVGDGSVSNPSWDQWIDINAFREAKLGTFGDSGVGILSGPGFWNVDMGVDKRFDLGGARFLALRVEAFNIFNHPNKGVPVRDFYNKQQFGQILSTASTARVLEFAAKFQF